jgi:dTDP-glucose 4,6-dehydratase
VKYSRYAVIGSNSFAGAAFVARVIADGAEVVGFNRSPEGSPIFLPYRQLSSAGRYTFVQADINHDWESLISCIETFRPQVVVDFAGQGMVAESWQDPAQWYTTNLVAKARLHDRLRQYDWLDRYVRISTPEVYGSQDQLLKETWQYNPTTPYAVSHAAVDMSLRAFHQHYGFPVILNRFANFYGPGQQLYRIVPRTIIYALTGRKLQLHGGGTSIRAFIYVDDVASGILRSLESGEVGEVYHFSPERFFTIRQVVEIVCQRLGVSFDTVAQVAPERPSKDQAYLMDSSCAREKLGWSEMLGFEQGVDRTIDWVKRNLEEINTLPLDYIHKS